MRFLLLLLGISFSMSLQAQKKLDEGQFCYTLYEMSTSGEKEVIGKAILLQRDNQQRFEILLNGFIGPNRHHLKTLLNAQQDTFNYFAYDAQQKLYEEKKGGLVALKKEVTATTQEQLTATTEKYSDKIMGYAVKKTSLKNEALHVDWTIYHTTDIQIPEHGVYFTLIPVQNLNFLIKAEMTIPRSTKKLVLELSQISKERPDAIWFEQKRIPRYPLEESQREGQDENSSQRLTDLFWQSSLSEQEALQAYHTAIVKSLEHTKNERLTNSLQTLAHERIELRRIVEELVTQVKSYLAPNTNFYTKDFFSEKNIQLLEIKFQAFADQITLEINPFIEVASIRNTINKNLRALRPKEQFSSDLAAYQSLTGKQAIALLRSYENLALLMELEGLQALAKEMNTPLEFTEYRITSFSRKPYVLLGETYETEIGIAQTINPKEIEVQVNGRRLPYENGKATYKHRGTSVGEQSYKTTVTFTNPETGNKETIEQEMSYEVGVASAVITADKMNVFYVGVDNPISVAAAGISSNDLQISVSGATIQKVSSGRYIIRATEPSSASKPCMITIRNRRTNRMIGSFSFRIKRIPNPVAKLTNNKTGGTIKAEEMRAQRGLMAILQNFDFDAKCTIHSYNLQTVKNGELSQPIAVQGGAFKGAALSSIQAAASGDIYLFQNIKARCPGDTASRKIGSMNFVVQ